MIIMLVIVTSALKNSKLCQSLAGSQDQQNEFHLTNIKEKDIPVPGSHRALSSSINEKQTVELTEPEEQFTVK